MSIANPLSFYLIPHRPQTVFSGLVNGTLSDPYMSIPYDNGVTGSAGAPIAGNTVWFGTSAGGRERGVLRLRSWPGGASGTLSVAENDDVTPFVQNNEFITIKQEWRLWPIYPRITLNGDIATIFVDYDIPWSQQTIQWRPVAVPGPPAVVEFNGTNGTANFVGDRSFALADGATITGYLWTAPGSVEVTSTSQGTEASPVTFTWTSTGQKLVYLRVTDSNGRQHANYTWAFVVDPNNPTTVAYTEFDAFNDNFDFEQGGGQCSFIVHGNATVADFPAECMVILASRGDVTTPTGYWPFRGNVHFVGYVVGKSVRQNPIEGDVSFRATTIDGLMRNVTAFPVSLTDKTAPFEWTMAKLLNTDRAAAYLWHFHSTLSLMTSIQPSNYTPLIHRQDFGPTTLYDQLQGELMSSLWGRVVSNHQSTLYHTIDYNLMLNSERSSVTTRKLLHKGIWVDDVLIEDRDNYGWPTNIVKMSGVYYPGGEVDDVCPLFSEAPGNAPKAYGQETNYDRLILDGQTNLNIRCGRALAKADPDYPIINMRFINDGSFTIAPQEIFPTNIEAADNNRGIAFTDNVIPRRMSRIYDNARGLLITDVTFEPETDGPPGATVDLPCNPPPQVLNNDTPPGTNDDHPPPCVMTPNQPANFTAGNACEDVAYCPLTATRGIVIWTDTNDGNDGKARVLDFSSGTITLGTTLTFETDGIIGAAITRRDDTTALLVWKEGATSVFEANVLTDNLDGTLSLGSATTFGIAGQVQVFDNRNLVMFDISTFLLVYNNVTTSLAKGIVLSVSGTSVSNGGSSNIDSDIVTALGLTRLPGTMSAVTVGTKADATNYAIVLTVSGTSFSAGQLNSVDDNPATPTANKGNLTAITPQNVYYLNDTFNVLIQGISDDIVAHVLEAPRAVNTEPYTSARLDNIHILIVYDVPGVAGKVETLRLADNLDLWFSQNNTQIFESNAGVTAPFLGLHPGGQSAVVAYQRDDNDLGYVVLMGVTCV